MPYSGPDDSSLPQKVKDMPQHDREIFVGAFNNSYNSCIDDGGKKDDCEGSAFAIAYAAVEKSKEETIATRMTQFRDGDHPIGQLCPYQDCCHDLAIPTIGWYKCGFCGREFYAGETDSDYEDYRCFRSDKAPSGAPAKPEEFPIAEDLGASWATPTEEEKSTRKESRMKITLRSIIDRVMNRAIKDVASWDGSASNYKDTDAYCAACLIDVNTGTPKTQDHCMLPVKLDGESEMVKQAIHACAGGHGLSQVKKPDDVDQDKWDAAVKAAANKIISAYGEMEEQAPDAIYELAGKTPPKEESLDAHRAKSLDEAFGDLMDQVWQMDEYAWLNGAFLDAGKMFAIVTASGKLYRADISVVEDSLTLSPRESWLEVKLDFPPVAGDQQQLSRTTIQRQSDGKFRWFSISGSAVLNRSGEIDSRALFDSFIKHAEETGEYPIREFFHAGEKFRTGQCDYLARDDFLLITSGVYDETEIGLAEVKARQENPEYWGDSIGFLPTQEPAKIRVAEGVNILAYDEGILSEISTLPEALAAAWYTATPTIKEVDRMLTQKQKDELGKLMGSPEAADKWLEENSATRNREIVESGKVTRQTVGQPPASPDPEGTQPEPEAETAQPETFVIDDAAFETLVSRVSEGLDGRIRAAVDEAVRGIPESVQTYFTQLQTAVQGLADGVEKRLQALEKPEDEKRQVWLQDAPKITLRKTVTPRHPNPDTEPEPDPESMADKAKDILASIPQWGPAE